MPNDNASLPDLSGTIAAFALAAHSGESFERACGAAATLYERARTLAASAGDELSGHADAALGQLGNTAYPLRTAFVRATVFAGDALLGTHAAVTAAALTAGELRQAKPQDVIAAIAVGCELTARVALTVAGPEFAAAWDARSALGVIGAAAAASRLTALDATQTRHALGLSATQSAGLAFAAGTDAARIACGKAAADALEAAILARHAFTSAHAWIEGRRGLAALMATDFTPAALSVPPGAPWIAFH